jgi:polar amino acid transport system substrate-binding protein
MKRFCCKVLALVLVYMGIAGVGLSSNAQAANERFKEVLARGVLRVGVQGALKPWSYRDPNGQLIGFEVDLAHDVANAMGLQLELVPIESANRIQFLQQGKIDVIIGTMGDTPERRQIVGMVEPHYFASGANVMAKAGAVKDWTDLRGKPVCAKQGVFYGKRVEQDFGAQIVAFTGNTEALQALRSEKCVAYLTDDSNISPLLTSGEWPGYEMPLPSKYVNVWAIGVSRDELGGLWGRFISGMVYKWHASGRILELSKKWGFIPIKWFTDMHNKLENDAAE